MIEPTTDHTCTRCGQPIAAAYPTRIKGEPYHAACARDEEAERMHLLACERCLDLFPPSEMVSVDADLTDDGRPAIECVTCFWQRPNAREGAMLMEVVIAEQNRGGDE